VYHPVRIKYAHCRAEHGKILYGLALVPSTGYETLIYDCMTGDGMLFKRADTIEAGWEIVESVLDIWGALPPHDFPDYAAGSWGPLKAGKLLARDGRVWKSCDIRQRHGGN